MLTISGSHQRFCDGLSRRQFMQVGALGIGGLTLADMLRADEQAGGHAKRRSIINICLPGGPSHMDTFDLKPQAPAEFRGLFQPIATNVYGVEICEHLPGMAKNMDKLAIIRSISDFANEHDHSQSDSGWSVTSLRSMGGRPSLGSVVSRLHGSGNSSAPPFVQLAGTSRPGFLGPVYQPYRPDGPGRANLSLPSGLTQDRLENRNDLLGGLDKLRRELDLSGAMNAMDSFNRRAVDVITSSALARAFDVTKEDPRIRERYGLREQTRHGDNGNFLLARRLIEEGVRCVSMHWGGWDTHGNNFGHLQTQLPELDRGVSALLEDLDSRGMLESTMILISGEFGRTPRVNGGAGRDHWNQAGFVVVGGGGLRTGQAIGSTNRLGEQPVDRPVHLQEVFAAIYRQLGIDPAGTTLIDPNGRPQYLVDFREPLSELV
ncbi:MAG: DUF1501 domain-containing protein [Pirellulales bacterium]